MVTISIAGENAKKWSHSHCGWEYKFMPTPEHILSVSLKTKLAIVI